MYIIAGLYKNRPLKAPKDSRTRPTSSRLRETLFNICQSYIAGARMLDLFAGSGAIGLEALSRGAKDCTFVDNSKESISCLKKNIHALGVENCTQVLFGDVFTHLRKIAALGQPFDLIFADPPYGKEANIEGIQQTYCQALVQFIDKSPSLLPPGGMLFIEEAETTSLIFDKLNTLQLIKTRHSGDTLLYQLEKQS